MTSIQILDLVLVVILILIVLLGFIAVLLIFKMRKKDNVIKDNQSNVAPKENVNLITRTGKSIN